MNDIGKIVRSVRKANGLTQKDMAEAMTISQPYICQVEKGKTNPSKMFVELFSLKYLTSRE